MRPLGLFLRTKPYNTCADSKPLPCSPSPGPLPTSQPRLEATIARQLRGRGWQVRAGRGDGVFPRGPPESRMDQAPAVSAICLDS